MYNILPLFELTPKKFHISAGETVPEQVHCCMRVLQEFQGCSVEVDGVQLLRTKFLGRKFRTSRRSGGPVRTSSNITVMLRSGFAAGVAGDGGYADVKLLLYADLGKHVAFDGTVSWR